MRVPTHLRGFVSCALLAAALWPARAAAADQWVEVRSPNFAVVSNAGEKHARAFAIRFEEVRATFLHALTSVRVPRAGAITVVIVKNQSSLAAFMSGSKKESRGSSVVGFSSPENTFIVFGSNFLREFADDVVLDLYAYHTVRHSFGVLPYWLHTGITAVFAETKLRGSQARFGAAHEYLGYFSHAATAQMSLDSVLRIESGSELRASDKYLAFRTKTWGLAHYLMFSGLTATNDALGELMRLWRSGLEPRAALEAVLGDLRETDRKINDYVTKQTFRAMPLRPPPRVPPETIPVRALSAGEVALLLADAHMNQRSLAEARRHLEQAILLEPQLSSVHEQLGRLLFLEGNHAAAIQSLDRAIELDPGAWLAHYYRGKALAASGDSQETYSKAALSFWRAIELAPSFAPAQADLSALFFKRSEKLQEAVQLAERAIGFDPANAETHMLMARLLLRVNRPDLAFLAARLAHTGSWADEKKNEAQALMTEAKEALAKAPKELVAAAAPQPHSTTGSQEAAEARPELKRREVEVDPLRGKLRGKVLAAKCSAFALDLTVEADGVPTELHSDNLLEIEWWGDKKTHPALLDPCEKLSGSAVSVAFRRAERAGEPSQILSLGVVNERGRS